jgi:hypothetical protein
MQENKINKNDMIKGYLLNEPTCWLKCIHICTLNNMYNEWVNIHVDKQFKLTHMCSVWNLLKHNYKQTSGQATLDQNLHIFTVIMSIKFRHYKHALVCRMFV